MYHRFILKYTKLAMYKILKYLKMTPGQGLFSQKVANREIEILPEVAWAFPVTKRHSTSGYCTFVWKNLVTWRSKKQLVVSRSSIEVEFRALSEGICDGIWFKRVLHEIGALYSVLIKVLYDDNKSAVKIAKNLFHCNRTKHVQMDHHFVTENIEKLRLYPFSIFLQVSKQQIFSPKHLITFGNLTSKVGFLNIYNVA
jgi:hypothetical protein